MLPFAWPPRFQYVWEARLIGVGLLSGLASIFIASLFDPTKRYVTVTDTSPGNPVSTCDQMLARKLNYICKFFPYHQVCI